MQLRRKIACIQLVNSLHASSKWFWVGHKVSMFDPIREYDMNMTRVFSGYGWTLMGLGYKRIDPKAT